jgi:hypothetical protein
MYGVVEKRPVRTWAEKAEPTPRRKPRATTVFAEGGVEPAIDDLLDDPVTAAIMRCDGVSPADLRALLAKVRHDLKNRGPWPPVVPTHDS